MTTYRVIALDPGGSTGYAVYTATKMPPITKPSGELTPEYYDEKWEGGTLGPDEHHLELEALLEMYQTSQYHIVCESFEFRQRDKDAERTNINLMSKEYIGVFKLVGKRLRKHTASPHVVKLSMQTASQGKGFVPEDNKKLKAMGLYKPGQTKHERDAYRHLIYYLVNKQGRKDLIQSWRNL